MTNIIKRSSQRRAVVLAPLLLAISACSSSLNGTYTDASGISEYEFRSDGKVYITVFGATASGTYEVDRDRVLISSPQGAVVFTRDKDRLIGPMGLELQRVANP
jgi:hypothetical protein